MSGNFVSRAGDKLEHALHEFGLDVKDLVCADLGCSTGGFTDCLLKHGASRVYSVDTGYGVLDWHLRQNPDVKVMERTNALHVLLPEPAGFISIDVGWTRQKLILPHALTLLSPKGGDIVSLVKPHYEADRNQLRHGQVIPDQVELILAKVISQLKEQGISVEGKTVSPVLGEKGKNIEYLIWIHRG
jgi:23S rRNA (cytidine1920-2'-O)/16S rRNA (cytidine1409-2'-O)-methyltransferase